jgi:ribosomal protein S18 acetylase RimI-like enzyme
VSEDLRRAFAFMARGDIAGAKERALRYGTAILTPELPLRHDSNYVIVDKLAGEVTAADLAAEAEQALGGAGLAHRAILVRDVATGERLASGFVELGWSVGRFLLMAQRRDPDRDADLSQVRVVGEAALRTARERSITAAPWGSPEVARQLLEGKRRIPLPKRFYAVIVDGEPVSWTDLYLEGDTAQVEDVGTVAEFRGRGYATAVVLRAVADARANGADLVFLTSDADDWPKELYRKLGFDELGGYLKFTRVPAHG